MTRAPDAVRRLFRVADNRATMFKPLNAIFPGYEAPVVRYAEDGERELVMMHWGFMLCKAARRVTAEPRLRPANDNFQDISVDPNFTGEILEAFNRCGIALRGRVSAAFHGSAPRVQGTLPHSGDRGVERRFSPTSSRANKLTVTVHRQRLRTCTGPSSQISSPQDDTSAAPWIADVWNSTRWANRVHGRRLVVLLA